LAIEKLRQTAIKNGLYTEQDKLNDDQLSELVFHSGLSTSEAVSDISGRGVGMDAIRKFVEKIGGTVEIKFKAKLTNKTSHVPFESVICIPEKYSSKVG